MQISLPDSETYYPHIIGQFCTSTSPSVSTFGELTDEGKAHAQCTNESVQYVSESYKLMEAAPQDQLSVALKDSGGTHVS